jgi:diguanylate cyclase (GGDEF)-like protein/PAS domain S-box-containing protein
MFLVRVEPGPRYVVCAVNRAGARALDLPEAEIVGRCVEDVSPATLVTSTLEQYGQAVRTRTRMVREHRFCVDGRDAMFQVVLTPIVEGGVCTHVTAVVRDVTEARSTEDQLREAQERFRSLVTHSPDITGVIDDTGRLTYVSPSVESWLGYDPAELVGKEVLDFIHPDDQEAMLAQSADVPAPSAPRPGVTVRARHRDGSWRDIEGAATDLRHDPAVRGVLLIGRDVTERVRVEEALRHSETRFRSLAATAPVGIVLADLDGTITYVNERLKQIFEPFEKRRDWRDLIHPDDRPSVEREMAAARKNDKVEFVTQFRMLTSAGATRWVDVRSVGLWSPARSLEGFVATVDDITERKEFEARLAYQAMHDPLTGLPNRALLEDRLAQALARARRRREPLAVLFLDLDLFKLVNTSYGHRNADHLLSQVGRRLQGSMRTSDTVARIGGDEFVIVAESATATQAEDLAARVLDNLRTPFMVEDSEVLVGASIGIATGHGTENADELIRRADAAMYAAKGRGRGQAVSYRTGLDPRNSQLETTTALGHAIERDELTLHYQPIIDLVTGETVRLEALVRWQHPERGLLLPAEFIPAAEQSGLILPLGAWVLEQACSQLRTWTRTGQVPGETRVAVNVSAHQLDQTDFVAKVTTTLERVGLEASNLQIEITETALVQDLTSSAGKLEKLNRAGVRLAVDDFGTGYASLSQLKRLPVQNIKIDHSFIDGLPDDPDDKAITSAMIRMAHELGLSVTAEGVETSAQRDLLRALGCNAAQGFLFARPQPSSEAEAWFTSSSGGHRLLASAAPPSPNRD